MARKTTSSRSPARHAAEASRRVWFVTFPGAELLDLAGPWAVLAHTNDALERPAYELVPVSVDGGTLTTRHALDIGSTRPLAAVSRGPLPHTIVVAGGAASAELPRAERAFAGWLARRRLELPRIVSICTGAFVLQAAGLLDKRRATTHWELLQKLAELSPETEVIEDAIFVRDGDVWTSAGITAGIDL
ncbi:MAG TPA: AraC family transcriptional regulator, partial [Polyangiaceae bacterium]|nr:AraC family transcriptional regulator [Polyangiaceae bacterium]